MRRLGPVLLLLLVPPAAGDAPDLSTRRIQADVARLASPEWEGRRAGTRGADRAAEWLAAEFRRIGLEPAGERGSYFQTFTFLDGVALGRGGRLEVPLGRRWRKDRDFRPVAFSAAGEASGEVVFAGYGISSKDLGLDEYAGVEVKDRVVLLLRFGPGGDDPHSKWAAVTALRQKAGEARDRGAKAVLFVVGPRTPNASDDLVPLRSEPALAGAGLPVLSVKRAVAEALLAGSGQTLEELQKRIDETLAPASLRLPGVRVAVRTDLRPRRSATRNVVGVLRGGSPDAVLVGAHYDHLGVGLSRWSRDPQSSGRVHHGADDNASGTAALLELARRLASHRASLARSVVFAAFAAEELGTLGSSFFVKHPPAAAGSVVAMVNMDMVGRLREDSLEVHGVGTSPVWKDLLEDANRAAGLKLKVSQGGFGPSDHAPFYAAGKPVFFVFTGNHEDYHKPSDTAEKVSAAGIARVLALVEPVVLGLARSGERVAFTRVAGEEERRASGSRGFRVFVGGVPDYSHEGGGVRFSGVTPGSPAEKAGVQAGDVLVRLGSRDVRDIYDYTRLLSDLKPGERVSAVVKRGEGEVALEITVAARPDAAR